jgi:hypothetical protein
MAKQTPSVAEVPWLASLRRHVEGKPLVMLRLSEAEWQALLASRKGVGEFTTALPHGEFEHVKTPTLCLVLAESDEDYYAYLALMDGRGPVTTLQSRVKIKRGIAITPPSPDALAQVPASPAHRAALKRRFEQGLRLTALSPKLSSELVEGLAAIETNAGPMRTVAAGLAGPRTFGRNIALQEDAIRSALKAFGLGPDDRAQRLELIPGRETALARVPIIEDGAIEHDARMVPGYDLVGSDLTGRAIFTRGRERLEVFTANRRQLEKAFGVDLVYLNVTRRNLVMLQYKMLEPPRGKATDWTFVPDEQLEKELARMRKFAVRNAPPPGEYRFNPSVFYLKFVKRDGAYRQAGIILPVDHYDKFVQLPAARGIKGGVRVSFQALGGSYMREGPFLDLIRAGYVGAYSDTTQQLETLLRAILKRGRAVVAAIQTDTESEDRSEIEEIGGDLSDVDAFQE